MAARALVGRLARLSLTPARSLSTTSAMNVRIFKIGNEDMKKLAPQSIDESGDTGDNIAALATAEQMLETGDSEFQVRPFSVMI